MEENKVKRARAPQHTSTQGNDTINKELWYAIQYHLHRGNTRNAAVVHTRAYTYIRKRRLRKKTERKRKEKERKRKKIKKREKQKK